MVTAAQQYMSNENNSYSKHEKQNWRSINLKMSKEPHDHNLVCFKYFIYNFNRDKYKTLFLI